MSEQLPDFYGDDIERGPYMVQEDIIEQAVTPLNEMSAVMPLIGPTIERTRANAREIAESYRGFEVSASGIVLDYTGGRIGVYSAGNFKARISEEDRDESDVSDIPKVCAEMDVMIRAELDGFERLAALIVSGTTRTRLIEEVTGVETKTLHPCGECRQALAQSPIVDRETSIITVGTGDRIMQVQSTEELISRYQTSFEEEFEDAPSRHYSMHDWADQAQVYERAAQRMTRRHGPDDPMLPRILRKLALQVLR